LTESGKIPEVVEISFGVERLMLALLQDSYENETLNENSSREVLKLHPLIAPYFVAIIPLKKSFRDTSDRLYTELLKNCIFNVTYEETDSIGKSYRRQDSIGTYFCVTVDSENAETVTLRKRDNMNQIRIDGNKILEHLKKEYEKEFLKFIS
jgi:glycyl-tRNA synthetase